MCYGSEDSNNQVADKRVMNENDVDAGISSHNLSIQSPFIKIPDPDFLIVCSIATFSNKLAGCLMLTLPMISLLWNVCVVKRVYEILYLLWSAWMRKRAKGRLAKYYP